MTAELLVAGSIALDHLEGPFGIVDDELGGSALHFALAASLVVPVRVVAAVGLDDVHRVTAIIGARPIDVGLVDVLDSPTYRWQARQEHGRNIDRGSRDGIYDHWRPRLPEGFRDWSFAGSMRPERQAEIAAGLHDSKLLAADAMLSYVRGAPAEAREVLRQVSWYFCNEEELAALGGRDPNDFRREWSIDGLVVKAGPGGMTAYTDLGSVHVPALASPLHPVVDTTGAGDAAAAGMLAHWLQSGGDPHSLEESLIWGVACASITIEDIGLRSIARATPGELEARVEEVRQCLRRES